MYPAAPPSTAPWNVRTRLPRAPIVVGIALTLLAAVVGLLPWPRPEWAPSTTWLVRDVPAAIWALLLTTALVSLAAGTVLLARITRLSPLGPATGGWLLLAAAAEAALVWNALYSAALSTIDYGALIPVLDWLFTFAPAALAGLVFRPRGKVACRAAGLCSGVVTLPLFALSFALLSPHGGLSAAAGVFFPVAVLGVAPLVAGVALAGVFGRR